MILTARNFGSGLALVRCSWRRRDSLRRGLRRADLPRARTDGAGSSSSTLEFPVGGTKVEFSVMKKGICSPQYWCQQFRTRRVWWKIERLVVAVAERRVFGSSGLIAARPGFDRPSDPSWESHGSNRHCSHSDGRRHRAWGRRDSCTPFRTRLDSSMAKSEAESSSKATAPLDFRHCIPCKDSGQATTAALYRQLRFHACFQRTWIRVSTFRDGREKFRVQSRAGRVPGWTDQLNKDGLFLNWHLYNFLYGNCFTIFTSDIFLLKH